MDKVDVACVYIHIYDEILLSHKKEWNFVLETTMNGLGGYYVKCNNSGRERQILDVPYMWNLKNTTN